MKKRARGVLNPFLVAFFPGESSVQPAFENLRLALRRSPLTRAPLVGSDGAGRGDLDMSVMQCCWCGQLLMLRSNVLLREKALVTTPSGVVLPVGGTTRSHSTCYMRGL